MLFNSLIFISFILLSAFFSASETALFSLSNLKLRKLSERYIQAKNVKNLLRNPTRLLSTIVFGNLLVNISFSSFSTYIFVNGLGEKGLFLAILISGVLILFLGEIFPKTLAMHIPDKLSLLFSPTLNILSKIFFPIATTMEKIVNYLSSLVTRRYKISHLGDEEFKAALVLGKKDGQISDQEEDMISHVLEFKDTKASEILTARIDIKGIDDTWSQEQVASILRDEKHSKFPVYRGSLDNITGILYSRDLFLEPDRDYHGLLRTPNFIPESKGIDDILKFFLDNNERIAIVLDEYGGAEGLLTLEDVIEEIFGEIYDEFEVPQEPLEKISQNSWRIYGKTTNKAVNLELDLFLPQEEDTIAGFLLSEMERIPRSGEKFKFKNIEFFIERATARRIVSVIIEIHSA